MLKKMKKNEGFTLVELIVVIAIIAILAVILVPNVLRYVERSRATSDYNTISSIENAVKTACADPSVNAPSGTTVSVNIVGNTGAGTISGSDAGVLSDVRTTVGNNGAFTAKSSALKENGYDITFTYNAASGQVESSPTMTSLAQQLHVNN